MAIADILKAELNKVNARLQFYKEEKSSLVKMLAIAGQVDPTSEEALRETTKKIILDIPKKSPLLNTQHKERIGSLSLSALIGQELGGNPNKKTVNTAFSILILKNYLTKSPKGHYKLLPKGKAAGFYAIGNGVRVGAKGVDKVKAILKPLLVQINK